MGGGKEDKRTVTVLAENLRVESTEYEKRAVAFLDILGFSRLVENADEPDWRDAIEGVQRTMRSTLAPNHFHNFRISQFSDCIVLSAPVTPYGIYLVMHGATMLAQNLLNRVVLLRGGIAVGNLIHTDDVMFGPGMLAAYSKDVRGGPPRISIDASLSREIQALDEAHGLEALIREDPYDLTFALHTLYQYQVYTREIRPGILHLDEEAAYLARTIKRQCYSAGHSPSVRAKWLWMERYWNEAVGVNGILPSTKQIVI